MPVVGALTVPLMSLAMPAPRAAGLMLLATILCVTATCLGWVPADSLWMR